MIEDLVAYLVADATMQALLPMGGSNKKFYPLEGYPGETTPYVLYGYQTDGTADDMIDESFVSLRVVAEDYATARAIEKRITELLDVQDDLKGKIDSDEYDIWYGKKVGGGSDSREEDTKLFHLARLYHLKFKRFTGG